MRGVIWTMSGVVSALLSTQLTGAASEFATVQLVVHAPRDQGCAPSHQTLRNVERRLSRQVFVNVGEADLLVVVTYEPNGSTPSAEVRLSTKDGQVLGHRRLSAEGADCTVLDDSLALVLALMVDLTREEVRARSQTIVQRVDSDVNIPAQTAIPEAPKDPPKSRYAASFQMVGTRGPIPHFALGGRLALDLPLARAWAVEIGVMALLPTQRADGPDRGARFDFMAVETALCGALGARGPNALRLCGGFQFGRLSSSGFGYMADRVGQSYLVNPFSKIQGFYALGSKVALTLAAGAAWATVRDEVYVSRPDGGRVTLFRPSTVEPFVAFGFSL